MEFIKLLPMILSNMMTLVTRPIFWIVLVIIWFQFRRSARLKSKLFNVPQESVLKPTLIATAFGLIGGMLGSLILIIVGVSVLEVGIQYLWPLAIVMMFINQRLMCFAYAGGLLALVKYFFGVPLISIPQVMGLVAILHFIEAVLILFSGHLAAVPIYTEDQHGHLVGGFNLQNFWPLPIVAMAAFVVPENNLLPEIIKMPDWWPLIKSEFLMQEENIIYMMLPVIAGLGYGDLVLTGNPKKKSCYSAFNLAIFSMILLGLSILSSSFPQLAVLAALFSPLGHEMVIYLGKRSEYRGRPKYINPPRGVMILDLVANSPLQRAGLASGDIILSINGEMVENTFDLQYKLQFAGKMFEIEYFKDESKILRNCFIYRYSQSEHLGLIVVPDAYS